MAHSKSEGSKIDRTFAITIISSFGLLSYVLTGESHNLITRRYKNMSTSVHGVLAPWTSSEEVDGGG